ncbi:ATPase, F1/V1/A1 complex, alpha/beta subunit [Tanacetum coccineum]
MVKKKKKQSLNDENMCNDSFESSQVDIGGEVDLGQIKVNSMVDVKNGSQTEVNSVLVDKVRVENVSNEESFVNLKTGKDNEKDNIVGSQGSNSQKGDKEGSKVSYAKIVNNNSLDNKLDIILTEINEDDVLSRTKFRNNEGIQFVIEMGPWMVNGKPMFMQKWDPSMSLDKSEPSKIPLWVKLRNLPLEAWTTMGISVVASRLGTPLIMDQVTTSMCKGGTGRFGFARVLIDVEAVKGIPDKVEILYKNRDGMVTEEFMEIEREELRKKHENEGYEHVRYKKKVRKKENPKGEKKINNEEFKARSFGNKNERGCRVLIGWDNEKIQGGIVHASDQAVICLFEIQSSKQRLFCTFIHAEISGKLRKKLWIDLLMRNFF